jgi:DinB family protein
MVTDDVRERVLSYIRHQAGKHRGAIIALVGGSQAQLLDVVAGVDEATADRAPAEGEWSIRELLRHVISAEDGVSRIVARLAVGDVPPGERTAGTQVEDATASALVERLRGSNKRMLDAIAALPAEPNTTAVTEHPFFGDLNCLEWAVFQRVHDADHAQHAQKILAAVAG